MRQTLPPTHSPCDPRRLELYLGDQLPTEEQARVEEHLTECQSCQLLIQGKAADRELWDSTAKALKQPVLQQVERARIRSLGQQLWNEHQSTTSIDPISSIETTEYHLRSWMAPTERPDALGRIAKYEVLELIGQGGMGLVLKAIDSELNRVVAIKTMPHELSFQSDARLRLAREARAAAALNHPNVMSIHGMESWKDVPFLVMPFLEGGNLHEFVSQHPLSIEEALLVALQVSKALVALHQAGIVHRDLKPSNILLAENLQHIVLSDFGLARINAEESITHRDTLAGTPYFMSPEQAQGKAIDFRSDLFSLGCVLYWLLTNTYPFRGATKLETLVNIVNQKLVIPTKGRNPIPLAIRKLLHGLLEKSPESRWNSAEKVTSLIQECLDQLALSNGMQVGNSESLRKRTYFWKKGRGIASLGLILLLIFLAGTITHWRSEIWSDTENPQTSEKTKQFSLDHGDSSTSTDLAPSVVTQFGSLSSDEVNYMLQDLSEQRNHLVWLRRLATLPTRDVPPDALPHVQSLATSSEPIERELATIILNKNPFELFLPRESISLSAPHVETAATRMEWLKRLSLLAASDLLAEDIESIQAQMDSFDEDERDIANQILDMNPFQEVNPIEDPSPIQSPPSPSSSEATERNQP